MTVLDTLRSSLADRYQLGGEIGAVLGAERFLYVMPFIVGETH